MSTQKKRWGLPAFCAKFLVFVIVLVIIWWMLLPYYGQLLLQASGIPLRHLFQMPIVAGRIEAEGVLNTNTSLIFTLEERSRSMRIALLVTNVPPYIALVLATVGLGWKRRARILLYGCGILCFFHVAFIVVAMRFQDAMMRVSEIPTAVVQFFLTLPFMLWVVFAYWDRLLSLGQEKEGNDDEAVREDKPEA